MTKQHYWFFWFSSCSSCSAALRGYLMFLKSKAINHEGKKLGEG